MTSDTDSPFADLTPLDSLPNLTAIILIASSCDPNDDGVIDVGDAVFALRAVELGAVLTASERVAVDVAPPPPSAPDGELTVGDAVVILRAAGGEGTTACGS